MYRIAPIAVAVVFLLGTGLAHGLLTDRWASGEALNAAVAHFEQLPMNLGDWEGQDLDLKNTPSTGLAGLLSRRYVHKHTGKTVSILLGVGKAGNVSIHTPDVCYAADGYEELDRSEYVLPVKSALPGAVFFRSQFVKTKAGDQSRLRIFWSWYADGQWQVANNPRWVFAAQPMLHKLYVIRQLTAPNESLDGDDCLEFMNELLPHLNRTVLAAS